MEKIVAEILELIEKYDCSNGDCSVNISFNDGWVICCKPLDWEFYGKSLEEVLKETIRELYSAIDEKVEDERDFCREQRERDEDYWAVQGAKLGFFKCF